MQKIVLASGNKGKVAEFSYLFEQYNIEVLPQSMFDVPDVAETGSTFVENAIIKARHASKITGLPAIADDSGLVVEDLDGKPGIYSARYAGEHGNDAANNKKLLEALSTSDNRMAKFLCVLVLLRFANDPSPIICQGQWQGQIGYQEQGDKGFGYDPLFVVPELNKTAAQLEKSEKSQFSHRAKALSQLVVEFKHEQNKLKV